MRSCRAEKGENSRFQHGANLQDKMPDNPTSSTTSSRGRLAHPHPLARKISIPISPHLSSAGAPHFTRDSAAKLSRKALAMTNPRCKAQWTRGDAPPPWMRPGADPGLVMQRCMNGGTVDLDDGEVEELIRELGRELDAMMAALGGLQRCMDGWMQ